jgi:hypothetical protein
VSSEPGAGHYKAFPETAYPGGHSEENQNKLNTNANILVTKEMSGVEAIIVFNQFVEASPLAYGRIMHASVRALRQKYWFYTEYGRIGTSRFRSLEILQRERLIDIQKLPPPPGTGIDIGYFEVTYLGVSFVRDCSPDAGKMADRRPKPIPVR